MLGAIARPEATGLEGIPKGLGQSKTPKQGSHAMMGRFCRYVDKVFHFGQQLQTLSDTGPRPRISAPALFPAPWPLFATPGGGLNRFAKEARLPPRFAGIVVPRIPVAVPSGGALVNLDA